MLYSVTQICGANNNNIDLIQHVDLETRKEEGILAREVFTQAMPSQLLLTSATKRKQWLAGIEDSLV